MSVQILIGDSREQLRNLPARSVHCCVTSPPYFGLRDYGCEGQIGLEATPDAYVAELVAVFREVHSVLRDDGTLWLNLGDSYAGSGTTIAPRIGIVPGEGGKLQGRNRNGLGAVNGLKPKDLIGIPWRVAFALQADGWYLRQDIIWHKPNPMPESVRDRCTKAHEYLFLLSKSDRYYYDAEAIKQRAIYPGDNRAERRDLRKEVDPFCADGGSRARTGKPVGEMVNRRSVWTVTTKPFHGAHFATFPPDLIRPCILAGCRPQGTVLDPFFGAGTTGLVAQQLGRSAIGIELNETYATIARERISADMPLFANDNNIQDATRHAA